jgi:acyl carrier protein
METTLDSIPAPSPMAANNYAGNRAKLVSEIALLVLHSVNLKHVDPTTITEDTVLVGKGLALDSIDILEIVVAVEQKFNVAVKENDDGKKIFSTIGSIADFVQTYAK